MNKLEKIDDLLSRGVIEVIDSNHLRAALNGKKKLRIKLGIDPTSPNIHIGRAVLLWKLRAFQDLGHQAVFIVGDFTGLVGDASDKDSERPMLTEEQVAQNLKTYFAQAFKILDKSKTETHYNSEWLKKLGFLELAQMASQFSLHEFSSRELVKKRLDAGKRVSFHELMYPLMQGYDSVQLKADVELGGTDQRFNLLAGRTLQVMYKQTPQDVLMMGLLEGLDGRKMSSSWGNGINITDAPADMFGKVMSLKDELVERYFMLTTRLPLAEVHAILHNTQNPRDQKLVLAETLVEQYHGSKEAAAAKEAFIAQFSNKELPSDIEQVKIKAGTYQLIELLVQTKLATSKGEARRLIQQGGVKIDQKVIKTDEKIELQKKNNLLLQVGKRKFVRIV